MESKNRRRFRFVSGSAFVIRSRDDVSRVMCPTQGLGVCHLSALIGCPTALAAYPPAADEQSLIAGIFGLATHRVCGLRRCRRSRWALTPPFHPYPPPRKGRAVLFCHTNPDVAAGFPLENVMLCVARTFLLKLNSSDRPHFCFIYNGAYSPLL